MVFSITRIYESDKNIWLNLKRTMLNQGVLRIRATQMKKTNSKETGLIFEHIAIQRSFKEEANLFSPESFIFRRLRGSITATQYY
jgi:hypothetical protein